MQVIIRIHGTEFYSSEDPDPDAWQKVLDPEHSSTHIQSQPPLLPSGMDSI
jgi:hypothetical protein